MRKILLVVALVMVIAIPAMSAEKPTPMNIGVYDHHSIYQLVCSVGLAGDYPNYICGQYVCVYDSIFGCLAYAWVARPLVDTYAGSYEHEITSAGVGSTYHVRGIFYSELPKNIQYRLIIKNGNTPVYKTKKIPLTPLEGTRYIDFSDINFAAPGLYTFTLQVFKPDGTIVQVARKVFVATPGAGSALEEEPVPEEEPALEEEPVLEESIEE